MAVKKFQKAYALNARSFSVLRELSHALMVVGSIGEAKKYAEAALKIAPDNPYVIDQVLALRVSARSRVTDDIIYEPEIADLLERLERYGDDEGRSFYAIRMADIYYHANRLKEALEFSKRASALTPCLFAAHKLEAEVLMKMGRMADVEKKLAILQRLLDDRNTGAGKTYLPEFILLRCEYFIEDGKYRDAVNLARAHEMRLRGKLLDLKKKIALVAGEKVEEISEHDRKWLKGA